MRPAMKRQCKLLFVVTACNKVGPIQQTFNIVKNLDRDVFIPVLITLYGEPDDGSSQLKKFLDLGVEHHFVPTTKKQILLGELHSLEQAIKKISPDVIHSLGVFPDYAVKRLGHSRIQLITLRNYMHDDYLSSFGPLRGRILEFLQMSAVKKARRVVACSKSLSEIYEDRKRLPFDYIRNGIDTNQYHAISLKEKADMRDRLGLPKNKTIFVYSGQLIPRKNQQFLLDVFSRYDLEDCMLLLLGGGEKIEEYKARYKQAENIDIRGNVYNVPEYLQASDVYISSSLSEGMPNGVLEAMATGLPVILSDIQQHKEIFDVEPEVGKLYRSGNHGDCYRKMMDILQGDMELIGRNSVKCVQREFSAESMSRKYQKQYLLIN